LKKDRIIEMEKIVRISWRDLDGKEKKRGNDGMRE
jgi:hypothetical protein